MAKTTRRHRLFSWLPGPGLSVQPASYERSSSSRVTGIEEDQWTWGDQESQIHALSTQDKENAYLGNPILWHGLNKKARDLVYSGFDLDSPLDGVSIPESLEKQARGFLTEHDVDRRMYQAVLEALWNGTGWIEWVTDGDKDPGSPLTGRLMDVVYVNTKNITGEVYSKDAEGNPVELIGYTQTIGAKKTFIHRSRLEPIVFHPAGNSTLGVGIPVVAQRLIKADNDATTALGDNLTMFGHPFPVINTRDNTNTKAVDSAWETLKSLRKKNLKVGFAGMKDDSFNLLNPATPSPADTLLHFYVELAAAIEIPMQLVIGSNMSQLTGNEMELADYYKSIMVYQRIVLTPIYNKLFRLLFGERWTYEIYWHPIYTDEKSQNEILTTYMNALGMAYSRDGIVDLIESRQLLRKAGVMIPEDGELDQPDMLPDESMDEQTQGQSDMDGENG